jgi:glucan phosphoethanolaminetransferase (alkaline phosphatase superfamily)
MKLPSSVRFFRKPDHISFLIGLTYTFETKLISFIFFTFTIIYETYEISKGDRQIFKIDHVAFVIGYIILIISFWEDIIFLLIISTVLFVFTVSFEIYAVRKNDLKNQQK